MGQVVFLFALQEQNGEEDPASDLRVCEGDQTNK